MAESWGLAGIDLYSGMSVVRDGEPGCGAGLYEPIGYDVKEE